MARWQEFSSPYRSAGAPPEASTLREARRGRATYYRPLIEEAQRDALVIAALMAVVAAYLRWSFWKCHGQLQLGGGIDSALRIVRCPVWVRAGVHGSAVGAHPARLADEQRRYGRSS
ncbi:MAG: hypothetical protein KF693_11740 [Nitrospira sp.]|nr:hypothetical protein [Nitrospira sp.]